MTNCSSSSSVDRVLSALECLKTRCPESTRNQISESVERFESEFEYLKLFVDCIHKWSVADEVVPNLDSLSIKIRSTMEETAVQIQEITMNQLLRVDEQAPNLTSLLPFGVGSKIERKRELEWVAKVNELLEISIAKVESFKPRIAGIYEFTTPEEPLGYVDMTLNQFMIRRYDYGEWEEFVYFVESKLLEASKRTPGFEPLKQRISGVMRFLEDVADSFPNNPKFGDFITHMGSVALRAGFLLCRWWVLLYLEQKFDYYESMRMDQLMERALLYLEQKIDFTSPEFSCVNISLLKSLKAINDKASAANIVNKFVVLLLKIPPSRTCEDSLGSIMPFDFGDQLVSLIKIASASNLSEEDIENMRGFLTDVKLYEESLPYVYVSNCIVNFLTKIWLMKLEIFLKDQVTTGNIFMLSVEEQLKALDQAVGYLELGKRVGYVRHDYGYLTENIELILVFLDKVAKAVAPLKKDMQRKMVRNILYEILLEMVLFKSEAFLLELRESNEGSITLAKEGVHALCGGLELLIMFVGNHPEGNTDGEDKVFAHILAMASRDKFLNYSLHNNDVTEDTIKDFSLFTLNLLDEIKHIMAELKDTYLHVPMFNFPKTNGVAFMVSLLDKLRELMKAGVDKSLETQIAEFLRDFEFLTPFVRSVSEKDIKIPELKELGDHIIDFAYEAEHCIDLMMLEDTSGWQNLLRLNHLRDDIRLVKTQVSSTEDKTNHAKEKDIPQTSVQKEPKVTISRVTETLVVLDDQEELIIDRLIEGTEQLEVVSVVGLPGIGKTTLARQVYNCSEVVSIFRVRTWCCISQNYIKRDVLLETLSHITALSGEILGMTDEDLQHKLRNFLLKRKFLIVMDDLWNTDALNDLRRLLPNDGNGSRILTTSRQDLKVSFDAGSQSHHLRLLSDAESWKLLQKKIFSGECCPEELVEIGEQIANKCKGLPLAIVAVAGLLQKRERQYKSWKEIEKDPSLLIVDDPQEQCQQILELSYKHLPDYLKACFLYFGAFLEDQDIAARKLMQLWISEGLVQRSEFKSLEDAAEDYLTDLIDRSLVICSRQRSRGGAKACCVHDVLRKFCQSKAKEDKFLKVITVSDEAPLHDLNYVFSAKIGNPSPSTTYEDLRLCFCSQRKHFIESSPSGPRAHSLLCLATNDKDPKCFYDISFISKNFRLLKVLDLECINTGTSFPNGIELLVHLRYLAISGYIGSIPPSIANLLNLETLIVKGLRDDQVISLPDAFWCLKKLRHVHTGHVTIISLQHGDSSGLDYLVTISSILLRFGKETECILRKIFNIRKLKCIFSECWDNSKNCNNFPRLEALNQLESLNITYYGKALPPGGFSFPSKLKKLTLSNFRLPWHHISVIGQLPNLEVLKFLCGAFDGENWAMVKGEFSELKYLKLDTLNIVRWNANSDHLPKLQQLVLRRCEQLEEVPLQIAYIPMLETINVQWCGNHIEESVRDIKENGDENLRVFINFVEVHTS